MCGGQHEPNYTRFPSSTPRYPLPQLNKGYPNPRPPPPTPTMPPSHGFFYAPFISSGSVQGPPSRSKSHWNDTRGYPNHRPPTTIPSMAPRFYVPLTPSGSVRATPSRSRARWNDTYASTHSPTTRKRSYSEPRRMVPPLNVDTTSSYSQRSGHGQGYRQTTQRPRQYQSFNQHTNCEDHCRYASRPPLSPVTFAPPCSPSYAVRPSRLRKPLPPSQRPDPSRPVYPPRLSRFSSRAQNAAKLSHPSQPQPPPQYTIPPVNPAHPSYPRVPRAPSMRPSIFWPMDHLFTSRNRPPVSQPLETRHAFSTSHGSTLTSPLASPIPYMPPTEIQYYGQSVRGHGGLERRPYFKYSQCTGKKKAVCIGINYRGKLNALQGCINDAKNMQRFLIRRQGYKPEDVIILTDDVTKSRRMPTRQNMIDAMKWLVRDACPNDSLFFHYSGHGGQIKDVNGDEPDGFDEVIFPVDHKERGIIVDDEMHAIMVKPLPAGCRLTAVFDCCHSGSALDLPYMYTAGGQIKDDISFSAESDRAGLGPGSYYTNDERRGFFRRFSNRFIKRREEARKIQRNARRTRASPADVISWSGCKDSQKSADTVEGGEATGAMSYAFMLSLKRNPHQSYRELLISVRDILAKRYSQKPQLSSSHPIDTNIMFIV